VRGADRANLRPIRLHDVRHGAASLRLASGAVIAAVSKMLGHSSIVITSDTYSHLLRGLIRQAAEAAMALVPRSTVVPTSFPHRSHKAPKTTPVLSPSRRKARSEGVRHQGLEPRTR
jgi:hypothetical protein